MDTKILTDFYKLHILKDEGGFVADLDFIFLKSFEAFRHGTAIIGTACKAKRKLSSALLGAVPDAPFINALVNTYTDLNPINETRWLRATANDSWNLAKQHDVKVIPRPVFYPWCPSNKRFLAGGSIVTKRSAAMQVWNNTPVDVLKKTIIGDLVAEIMAGQQATAVTHIPGLTLLFD